jgi:magnesium transporter
VFTLHAFHPMRGHWLETDLAALPKLREDPQISIWLDLQDPTEAESRVLTDVFQFHPLAIEDMLQDYGHPKLDLYDGYVFLIVHGINFDTLDLDRSFVVDTLELDLFAGPNFVVTHHSDPPLRSIRDLHKDVRDTSHRPWVTVRLLHRMLDRLVDNYLPVMEKIGCRIDDLEEKVIQNPTPDLLLHVLEAKKTIHRLRRMTNHQRGILESLARGHIDLIPRDSLVFYRDIFDHFVRVADLAETYREEVQGAIDAYLSVSANKTNEIMKALTQISTVMLPLTFIAGIYGMNFDIMPELKWTYGYPFALALMLLTAVGIIVWFRRRHWL